MDIHQRDKLEKAVTLKGSNLGKISRALSFVRQKQFLQDMFQSTWISLRVIFLFQEDLQEKLLSLRSMLSVNCFR